MSDDTDTAVVKLPRASAPASVYLGNSVYCDFTGRAFKLYVSDGRFAGPPIHLSPEDVGQLFNYVATCLEAVEVANNE